MSSPPFFNFTFNNVKVKFPHESPYPAQRAIMSKSISAFLNHENALLESPTGTGKSLALLASALAYQECVGNKPYTAPNKRDPYKHHNEELIIDDIESIGDNLDGNEEKKEFSNKFTPVSQMHKKERIVIPNPPDDMIKCNVVVKRHNVPVWYTSRTHTQLKQLIGELKKLDYHPQMTILGARKRICLFKKVALSDDPDSECINAVSKKQCPYFGKKKIPPEFRPYGSLEKFDLDDLIRYCEQKMVCPYFLSREMMKHADLVFCSYNFLMNPKVKGQMMLSILGTVLIVDEAHNLEQVIRESISFHHDRGGLQYCVGYLNQCLKLQENQDFQTNITIIKDLFSSYLKYISTKAVAMRSRGVNEFIEQNNKAFFATLGITKMTWPKIRMALDYTFVIINGGKLPEDGSTQKIPMFIGGYLEQLYVVIAVCFKYNCRYMNSFKFILDLGAIVENDTLSALNMDPGAYFTSIADEVNSVILSSGTLSPLPQMEAELGTPFKVQLTASHVIKPEQLQVYTINEGLDGTVFNITYQNLQDNKEKMEFALGQMLIKVLPAIPGGVLFFFPSHSTLSSTLNTWREKGMFDIIHGIKPIFFEEQSLNAEMYVEYKSAIENQGGAILLGVCRGRMSEGIDFYDEQARCVIIYGIPYPPLYEREVRLKKQFNDERYDLNEKVRTTGKDWYDAQAYRALFQATGRCIRHQKDYGSILLIDSRFTKQINRFPRWMQPSFHCDAKIADLTEDLKAFYKQMEIKFPPREYLRKNIQTAIVCNACGHKIFDIPSLEHLECSFVNRNGLHTTCGTNIEDGNIYVRQEDMLHLSPSIKYGTVSFFEEENRGYQPIICQCNSIIGAIFKVGKLEDVSKLDGAFLSLSRIKGCQGKLILPLTTVLTIKQNYTIKPQGRGQQILCLTPSK